MPWREEAKRTGLDPITVYRLMYRHGYRATEILENARKDPALAQTLCECEQIIAAEVEYCVREEWAKNLSDLRRRTRMGRGPCQSCRCVNQTALFMGSLLRWPEEQINYETAAFLDMRFRAAEAVLYGEQAKQAEYARSLHLMSMGEDAWTERG
jgi:glycerol-3-phosphate dehydrogenase